METKIDNDQYELLRNDLLIWYNSMRSGFRWLLIWVFLSFVIHLLQWLGIHF